MRSGSRVLVADDERLLAELLCRQIREGLGCFTQIANTGDEVLTALQESPYDVLTTDMVMPGIYGLELIRWVRAKHPEVDILVISAHAEDFPYVEVLQAGARDFIIKPYDRKELEAKLLRILTERDLRAEVIREGAILEQNRRQVEELRAAQVVAEAKYKRLFEMSMNGMLILRAEDLAINEVNHAFAELCGRPIDQLIDMPLLELISKPHRSRLETLLPALEDIGRGTIADVSLMHADGSQRYLDISLTFIEIEAERIVLFTCKDVTAQRDEQDRLVEKAHTDELTGLLNQRCFKTRVEGWVSLARNDKIPLALIYMDLDNFKRCNDTYGHQKGDELLKDLGTVIRKCIRKETDEGFRCGGDEFAVVLRHTPLAGAVRCAERIREAFERIEPYGTSLSVGIACYESSMGPHEFVEAADQALYQAKSEGKDLIHVA